MMKVSWLLGKKLPVGFVLFILVIIIDLFIKLLIFNLLLKNFFR